MTIKPYIKQDVSSTNVDEMRLEGDNNAQPSPEELKNKETQSVDSEAKKVRTSPIEPQITLKHNLTSESDNGVSAMKEHADTSDDRTKANANENDLGGNDNQMEESKEKENTKNGIGHNGIAKKKLGRRGDPRMHRAVAARLNNPQMSLLDALLEGGFVFPNIKDDKDKAGLNGQIADSDNVQLCQRKNQLSRRLRLARQLQAQNAMANGNCNSSTGGKQSLHQHEDMKDENHDGNCHDENNSGNASNNLSNKRMDNTKRKISNGSERDDNSGLFKRAHSNSPNESNSHDDSNRDIPRRNHSVYGSNLPQSQSSNSLNSLASNLCQNQFPSSYHHRSSIAMNPNSFHNPYLGASGELLSSLKASTIPSSMSAVALHHQQLLLQHQAALQDPSSLSLQNHGAAYPPSRNASINAGRNSLYSKELHRNSLYTKDSLSEIEHALRHQQEMARIVATAKLFSKGAGSENDAVARDSYIGLRHSLTGGVLQDSSQGMDDDPSMSFTTSYENPVSDEEKFGKKGKLPQRLSNTSAAIAHAQHLKRHSCSNGSALSSAKSIASITSSLKAGPIDNAKMNVALDVFRAENASLMKRCLLMAGFEGPQTEECSALYLEFLSRVIKVEEQRLSNLCINFSAINCDKVHNDHNSSNNRGENENVSDSGRHDLRHYSPDLTSRRKSGIGESHANINSTNALSQRRQSLHPRLHHSENNFRKNRKRWTGRHIHRLNGGCGHKAIIHRPLNGPAHVDFVVNGKVECYQDLKPYFSETRKGSVFWPSRFKCEEVECGGCDDSSVSSSVSVLFLFFFELLKLHKYTNLPNPRGSYASNFFVFQVKGERAEPGSGENDSYSEYIDPKLLEVVDFKDKEWNENFLNLSDGEGHEILSGLLGMNE